MFDNICIRNHNAYSTDSPISVGFLAEALLYYRDTRLILSPGILRQLLRDCGPDALIRMAEEGHVHLSYLNGGTGVRTENTGTRKELHRPILYHLPSWDLDTLLLAELEELLGGKGKARRLARRILPKIHEVHVGDAVLRDVLVDYADGGFLERFARDMVAALAPGLAIGEQSRFRVSVAGTDEGGPWLRVDTDIDFSAATAVHQRALHTDNALTPAHVLSWVLNAQENLYFAGLYTADMSLDPLQSRLITEKCGELLRGRASSADHIRQFQEVTLSSAHAVAEAIDSGERTFMEFLDVLHEARRFKNWLAGQEPDESLISSYVDDISNIHWISQLPARSVRWMLLTGMGVAGAYAGPVGVAAMAGLGLADTLLTERLIAGWRPDQFVHGRLRRFTEGG